MAQHSNEVWSMDFVADNHGRKLRALTVVDQYSRECVAIHVGQRLTGEDVVQVMQYVAFMREHPKFIKTDNGSEFIFKALDKWADENQVTMDFSGPGNPTDNAFIESFNGRLRHWMTPSEYAQKYWESTQSAHAIHAEISI